MGFLTHLVSPNFMLWLLITLFGGRRSLGVKKKKGRKWLGEKERKILHYNSSQLLTSKQCSAVRIFLHSHYMWQTTYNYQIHDYCWNPKTKVTPKKSHLKSLKFCFLFFKINLFGNLYFAFSKRFNPYHYTVFYFLSSPS